MANPEIDNYVRNEETKGDAMQKQEQNLKEYYRTVFTLKNGKQIEICTKEFYENIKSIINEQMLKIKGFIAAPLIVEKIIKIDMLEIAAVESTFVPHITWKNIESDVSGRPESTTLQDLNKEVDLGKHPEDCMCGSCHPAILEIENTAKVKDIRTTKCFHAVNETCSYCELNPIRKDS